MIITNDADLAPFASDIDALFITSFNGLRLADSNPAALRSLQCINGSAASFAAAHPWTFDFIKGNESALYMLGYVCTDPAMRGRGLASACVAEIIGALPERAWIVVLNCKEELVPFYGRCGFSVIAPKASYDRNGAVEIDDDPVMARCSSPHLMSAIETRDVLHLGEEF